jgi:hypothetical protein
MDWLAHQQMGHRPVVLDFVEQCVARQTKLNSIKRNKLIGAQVNYVLYQVRISGSGKTIHSPVKKRFTAGGHP